MPNHPTLITDATVQCGFPLPAQATMHKRLDLNDLLVKHPGTTYCVPVRGESMRDAGINDGDTVLVDTSLIAKHGYIVLAVVDGDYTVKRLYNQNGIIKLEAANPDFPDIEFKDGQELTVWGVVTWTLKPLL
ncbi:LexA family protein [Paenalcaligenes suwonensis]|uniref:LexA family protein n=1 Tax=Paenalcaligenes suwonensis TaxID=1202713 RepID=UPI00140D4D44|nr:translesion error-prone DNA polymerase V autoproteolytic subunit [Paenalcaligenes suwonensis]NHC62167.1 translesion error-prone DNA polymerase V autoproteolytic subunit [Paenalcaligenes suwonensis]